MTNRNPDDPSLTRQLKDAVTQGSPSIGSPVEESYVAEGTVLWTLTHEASTAQARRWVTQAGFELELQIWTGAHVAGQEDLCWTQLFPSDNELDKAAAAKKAQLEASGWLEQIDVSLS